MKGEVKRPESECGYQHIRIKNVFYFLDSNFHGPGFSIQNLKLPGKKKSTSHHNISSAENKVLKGLFLYKDS